SSSAEVLLKVIEDDPVPIRRIDSHLSVDVETIVMKCLEKDPARRYDSAADLAEDLRRYLEGETIKAGRAALGERILKRVKKNRALTTVVSVVLISTLVLGGMSLYTYMKSAEEAVLAQQLGQEIERMDSIIRQARLLPLH